MSDWQQIQSGDYLYAYGDKTAYIRHVNSEEWTVLDNPTSNASIRKIYGIERASEGPFTWRRYGTNWALERTDFNEAPAPAAPAQENPSLYLVLQVQAKGEPNHWSLFVAREGKKGDVYQVKGDAESMSHRHAQKVNIFLSLTYRTSYVLVQDLPAAAEAWVKSLAETETPPSAPNRAAVRENCQGWACRVLAKLVEKGIVSKDTLASVQGMIEPIN